MCKKPIIYSYREGDKKRGKLLFTEDKTLEKDYPNSFGVSRSAMGENFLEPLSLSTSKTSKSRVIIIGNSPEVLKNKYGSLIDSYDIVIRINKCVTKNHEKYVGSKIDIWATTYNTAEWYGEDYIPDNYKNITQIWRRTPGTRLKNLPEELKSLKNQVQMYKSSFWRQKQNKEIEIIKKYNLKSEPCTGLLTILTAIRFYEDITVYGFSFFSESDGLVRDYYAFDQNSISEAEFTNYERVKNSKDRKNKYFFSQNEIKLKILKELELNNKIKILK